MSETQPHNQESATTLPGAILKRCREYHGISLHDAAEATKIGVNYLTALEEDRASEFASLAYLKGFLRIYATHLGLNPEDMLRLYERLYEPPEQPSASGPEASDEPAAGSNSFRWRKLLLPAILLLMMLVVAAILNHKTNSVPPSQAVAPAPATPLATLPQPPVQSSVSSVHQPAQKPEAAPKPERQQRVEVSEPEPPARQPAPESSKSFIAGMRVTKNGSLTVIIDGATPQHYELSVGDMVEWKAEKSIALELSNGGGVEVEVNGKSLAPLVSAGVPVYVVIDAEGIKK